MGSHKKKYISIRKKRIFHIPNLDNLVKTEANYCIDEIAHKISLLGIHYNENMLHEIRISLRKLKSLIYFFRDNLPKEEFLKIKFIIHKLIAPTSKVRDYDVVKANYIYPICLENTHDDAYKSFMIHCNEEISNLQDKTLKELTSHKYIDSLSEIKRLVNENTWKNSENSTYSIADLISININNKLKNIYNDIWKFHRLSNKKLHKLRIKIKEIRYIIELFKFYIKNYEDNLNNLKLLQDTLGEINDTYVAGYVIDDLNSSRILSSQHRHIENKILSHRKSNISKLKNQL